MDEVRKSQVVKDAKGLSKWFSVDVSIKIFGSTIWSYHWPPKN